MLTGDSLPEKSSKQDFPAEIRTNLGRGIKSPQYPPLYRQNSNYLTPFNFHLCGCLIKDLIQLVAY